MVLKTNHRKKSVVVRHLLKDLYFQNTLSILRNLMQSHDLDLLLLSHYFLAQFVHLPIFYDNQQKLSFLSKFSRMLEYLQLHAIELPDLVCQSNKDVLHIPEVPFYFLATLICIFGDTFVIFY